MDNTIYLMLTFFSVRLNKLLFYFSVIGFLHSGHTDHSTQVTHYKTFYFNMFLFLDSITEVPVSFSVL